MRPIRNSSAEAGGNLGAPPKPPKFGSNWAARFCSASSITPADGASSGARTFAGALSPSTVRGADSRISSRRVLHASATPSSTWRKLGIPCRGSGGKYVPP